MLFWSILLLLAFLGCYVITMMARRKRARTGPELIQEGIIMTGLLAMGVAAAWLITTALLAIFGGTEVTNSTSFRELSTIPSAENPGREYLKIGPDTAFYVLKNAEGQIETAYEFLDEVEIVYDTGTPRIETQYFDVANLWITPFRLPAGVSYKFYIPVGTDVKVP